MKSLAVRSLVAMSVLLTACPSEPEPTSPVEATPTRAESTETAVVTSTPTSSATVEQPSATQAATFGVTETPTSPPASPSPTAVQTTATGQPPTDGQSTPTAPTLTPQVTSSPGATPTQASGTDIQTPQPTPGQTAPVETAPVETAPVETAPVETAPVETAPVDTAPAETVAPTATPTDAQTTAPQVTPTVGPNETPLVTPTPGLERDDTYYYDPDRLLEVSIEMDPDDYYDLTQQERYFVDILKGEECRNNPPESPYTWFEAVVTVDGTRVEQVGVRKKGFFGSASKSKPGLKIKFDKFVDDQELDGMERLTFNNGVQDPSLIQQCMAYSVFTDAGMPAPRCNFARVTVNGDYKGVYVNIEPIKKAFLREHFPDEDGDLYEGTLADFRDEWVGSFEAKTSDTDPDRGPILDITEAAKAEDDVLVETLGAFLDVDAFFTYWALEVLVGHEDSYTSFSNNFLVYREPDSDLSYFIPWGADNSMNSQTALSAASILPYRLWLMEETRALYIERLFTMLDSVWDEEAMLAETERMEAMLAPHALAPEKVAEGLLAVRSFISERRAFLESTYQVEENFPSDPGPPRNGFCVPYRGVVEMNFSSTWPSEEDVPPQRPGSSTLRYTWNAEDPLYFSEDSGVLPGTGTVFDDDGDIELTIVAQDGLTTEYTGELVIPIELYGTGTRVFYGHDVIGYLSFEETLTQKEISMGMILDGEYTLDEASIEPGGAVSGTISGDLYGFF